MALEHLDDEDLRGEVVTEEEEFDGEEYFLSDNTQDLSEWKKSGQPDFLSYRQERPHTVKDLNQTVTYNDWYLHSLKDNPLFSASIEAPLESDSHTLSDKDSDSAVIRPARLEGGHGLSQLMARPSQLTCGMASDINQISCSSGCVGLCSFCKESNSARGLTSAPLFYPTENVILNYNGKKVSINSDTRVMAYDPVTDSVVSLPIGTAVRKGMPINKKFLERMIERHHLAVRLLSD